MSSTSTATTRPALRSLLPARGPAAALALGLLVFALAFAPEIGAAVHVWEGSTAYGHCFLVLPIALYLGWERRERIAATPIAPLPAAMLLALPVGLVWFLAERLGIMEGRQLAAMALLQLLFLAVLGWRMWWAMSVPLLYLFFLVPFGAFVTPYLQNFTADFVRVGLDVLGIPAYVDSFRIDIPEGSFVVAEACAGLRFLIASIAFGVLYAFIIYRSPSRRIAFIGVSILLPIVANGFRALGIVVLGHMLGSAEAAATDHVLYGWIFFSIVILLLIAAGMPFREDVGVGPVVTPLAPADRRLPSSGRLVGVAICAALLAALGPLTARALDRSVGTAPDITWPTLALPEGCEAAPPAPVPSLDGGAPGERAMTQHVTCGPDVLTVTLATLPPRSNPSELALAQRHVDGEDVAEDATLRPLSLPGITPATWRLVSTQNPALVTALTFWIDGKPAQAGLAGRATQALASIRGTASAPVLMAVGMKFDTRDIPDETGAAAVDAITRYLAVQTGLPQAISGIATPR